MPAVPGDRVGAMLRRVPFGYLLVLGLAIALAVRMRPRDEAALPDQAARPRLDVQSVAGLDVAAVAGRPEFHAGAARPTQGGGVVALGGTVRGVEFDDIVMRIGAIADAIVELTAAHGATSDTGLVLERVTVQVGGATRVTAATAHVADGAITFPGLVVFDPDAATRTVDRNLTLRLDELVQRTAGR